MIHSASSMAARPNQSAATVHRSRAKPTTRPMTSHATPSSPKSHRCQRRRRWRLPGAWGPLGDTTRQPYAAVAGAYVRARPWVDRADIRVGMCNGRPAESDTRSLARHREHADLRDPAGDRRHRRRTGAQPSGAARALPTRPGGRHAHGPAPLGDDARGRVRSGRGPLPRRRRGDRRRRQPDLRRRAPAYERAGQRAGGGGRRRRRQRRCPVSQPPRLRRGDHRLVEAGRQRLLPQHLLRRAPALRGHQDREGDCPRLRPGVRRGGEERGSEVSSLRRMGRRTHRARAAPRSDGREPDRRPRRSRSGSAGEARPADHPHFGNHRTTERCKPRRARHAQPAGGVSRPHPAETPGHDPRGGTALPCLGARQLRALAGRWERPWCCSAASTPRRCWRPSRSTGSPCWPPCRS